MGIRAASAVERTGVPGPEGSTMKLLWSELDQRVKATAIEILGPDGMLQGDDRRLEFVPAERP